VLATFVRLSFVECDVAATCATGDPGTGDAGYEHAYDSDGVPASVRPLRRSSA